MTSLRTVKIDKLKRDGKLFPIKDNNNTIYGRIRVRRTKLSKEGKSEEEIQLILENEFPVPEGGNLIKEVDERWKRLQKQNPKKVNNFILNKLKFLDDLDLTG